MTNPLSRLTLKTVEPRQLALQGDLDAHTAPLLEEQLAELGTDAPLSLLLGGVAFMDSSGIRTIVEAHEKHAQAGSTLHLVDPSEAVVRILEITGLHDVLTVDR